MLYDESADTLDVRGATAAGPGVLKLTTGELTNVDGGILGRLEFQAPLDSAGTDACLVAASIWAEADATFSAAVNTTDLVFATATSETAAEKMRITSGGCVGIGTATPAAVLHVEGNAVVANGYGVVIGGTAQQTISDGGGTTDVVPELQVLGTAAADMTELIGGWSTTATRAAAPTLALLKSGNATIASHTVVTDNEILGSIIAYGDDGTDYESPAAAIEFAVDGTPGTGCMPGDITFYTTAAGGETLTSAMTINSAQEVGISGGGLEMHISAPLKMLIAASTVWTLGWWQSSDNRWWLLGNTADVSSFVRGDAEFYIPTGNISDVPSS
jgi:hypothetical protein